MGSLSLWDMGFGVKWEGHQFFRVTTIYLFVELLSWATGRSSKGCGIFPDCVALTVTASRSYCNIDAFFVFLSRSLFNETILGHLLILSSTSLWKGCWPHSVCHSGGGGDYCQFQESEPVISTLGIMKIKWLCKAGVIYFWIAKQSYTLQCCIHSRIEAANTWSNNCIIVVERSGWWNWIGDMD